MREEQYFERFIRLRDSFLEKLASNEPFFMDKYELIELAEEFYANSDITNLGIVIDKFNQIYESCYSMLQLEVNFHILKKDFIKAFYTIDKIEMLGQAYNYNKEDSYRDDYANFGDYKIQCALLKGKIHEYDNQRIMAEKYFHDAMKLAHDSDEKADIASQIHNFYNSMGKYEEGKLWAERAIKYNPNNKQAKIAMVSNYIFNKKFKEAIKGCQELIDEDPYNVINWTLLGSIYSQNKDYENAINAFENALAIDENNYEAIKNLIDAYIQLKNSKKVIELLNKYNEINPGDYPIIYYCVLYLYESDYYSKALEYALPMAESTEYLEKADNKKKKSLFEIIIQSYVKEHYNELAMIYVKKAIQLNIDNSFFYLLKGYVHTVMSEYDNADDAYNMAIELSDNKDETIFDIAHNYFSLEDYERCEQYLVILHDKKYNHLLIPTMLAVCYEELDCPNLYLECLKEAIETEPSLLEMVYTEEIGDGMTLEEFYEKEKKEKAVIYK